MQTEFAPATSLIEFVHQLSGQYGERVYTFGMLSRMIRAAQATRYRIVRDAVEEGFLLKLRAGLYLNLMVHPAVQPAEAAQFIRGGSIVSLHTVLGDAGILHNYTRDVFAIFPVDRTNTGGIVQTPICRFVFYRLNEKALMAGEFDDRYDEQALNYLRTTPEKALMDWISLGLSPRSHLPMPPAHDIEFDDFDQARLERLATAHGYEQELDTLRERAVRADRFARGGA